ncbi:MAG: hypothetical protein ACTSUC_09940 [Promethearchaeota archaeon]
MDKFLDYKEELKKAMEWLGRKNDTIFIGQTVKYNGSPMFFSLKGVPDNKKIEFPVAENMQMGVSIGLSLEGFIPISIYPRIDFLMCAMDQLVNHLDKIKEMSHGEFRVGLIIRTQIGNKKPLYPGCQHCGDYGASLQCACKNIHVVYIRDSRKILDYYKSAYILAKRGISTILIETPQGGDPKSVTWN